MEGKPKGKEMTPYQQVLEKYELPFPLYPFQENDMNEWAADPRTGLYYEPGLGKTPTSTVCSLYKMTMGVDMIVVLMPPILISRWARWLAKVKQKDGTAFKILSYQGTPKVRKAMSFKGQDFILMSMPIFKRDYERICNELGSMKLHVILDEAQCIKDVGTDNYKLYRDFVETHSHQLLTGTPLNNPLDAYAYVKLITPQIYPNLAMFERCHVYERDFFDKPISFQNLELLASNLLLHAVRRTKEECLKDLPECIIQPFEYDLDPRHLKLYRQLVDEQLLKLPDGDKIDATQASALYHALGQIIMQWHYFGQDEKLKSAGFDVIDEVLDELGDKKLIVFGNYRRTNAAIVKRYGCPGVWGEVPPKKKQEALDKFIDDPRCRMIVLHPISAGQGIDGLQDVCADILYVEPPIAVSHWTQSLSRAHRDGQKNLVTVRMAQAIGTIQQHLVKRLTEKEALVNPIQGSRALLRDALLGNS